MHDGRVQLLDKVEDSDGSFVGFEFRRCFDIPRVFGQSGHLRVFLSASSEWQDSYHSDNLVSSSRRLRPSA